MILGLTGYASSGKDTVADYLVANYGFTKIAYADKLKEFLMRQNPTVMIGDDEHELATFVAESSWDTAKQNVEVRALLQRTGEGAKLALGDSVWLNALLLAISQSGYTPENGKIVIPDVRYPNEITPVQTMWRVTREGVGPVNGHPSESYVMEIPASQTITNDGTLEELYRQVDEAFLVGGETDGRSF